MKVDVAVRGILNECQKVRPNPKLLAEYLERLNGEPGWNVTLEKRPEAIWVWFDDLGLSLKRQVGSIEFAKILKAVFPETQAPTSDFHFGMWTWECDEELRSRLLAYIQAFDTGVPANETPSEIVERRCHEWDLELHQKNPNNKKPEIRERLKKLPEFKSIRGSDTMLSDPNRPTNAAIAVWIAKYRTRTNWADRNHVYGTASPWAPSTNEEIEAEKNRK